MADAVTSQTIVDTDKRAVIKITNISDYPMTIKLSISHSGEYAMSVAVMFNETHINTETIF